MLGKAGKEVKGERGWVKLRMGADHNTGKRCVRDETKLIDSVNPGRLQEIYIQMQFLNNDREQKERGLERG